MVVSDKVSDRAKDSTRGGLIRGGEPQSRGSMPSSSVPEARGLYLCPSVGSRGKMAWPVDCVEGMA